MIRTVTTKGHAVLAYYQRGTVVRIFLLVNFDFLASMAFMITWVYARDPMWIRDRDGVERAST